MQIYYSKETKGFYRSNIHSDIPADRVEISQAEWLALLSGQSAGQLIASDGEGRPILVDRVIDAESVERKWRDALLVSMAWLRDRHRDQVEIGADTTLGADQFQELLVYMQALRDWPQSAAFPAPSARPQAPGFLESLGGVQ